MCDCVTMTPMTRNYPLGAGQQWPPIKEALSRQTAPQLVKADILRAVHQIEAGPTCGQSVDSNSTPPPSRYQTPTTRGGKRIPVTPNWFIIIVNSYAAVKATELV